MIQRLGLIVMGLLLACLGLEVVLRESIAVVDLSVPFREQTQAGRELVFPIDAHWTAVGHQLAANALLASPLFQADGDSGRSDR